MRPPRSPARSGRPAPVISRIPTARRCRSTPEAPSGNAARRISRRNVRPRSGSGSSTRPSAATGSAGVALAAGAKPHERRPAHGLARRLEAQLAHRRAPRRRPLEPRAVRPSSHEPIHGRGERSNARDARNPGRPWKRPDDSNVAPPRARPASASIALSGARGSTVPQPSASHVARGGRRDLRARSRARRPGGRGRARLPRCRAAGRAGTGRRPWCARTGTSGRWRRGRGPRAPARRAPAAAAPRAPARPGCAARGSRPRPPGTSSGAIDAGDPHAQRAHAAQAELEPVPALAHRERAAGDLDRGDLRAPVGVRAAARSSRRRVGRSKPISSQWRASSSARSACQWVAASPSKAANGRRSGNCE